MIFGLRVTAWAGETLEEARKHFFFEKKKQKTFYQCGRWDGHGQRAEVWGAKVFCFPRRGAFFSKKKCLLTYFSSRVVRRAATAADCL
jgi:hypothetical protein